MPCEMAPPNSCGPGSIWRAWAPHPSVEQRWRPTGSSNALRCTQTVSCRRPKTYATTVPLAGSMAGHNHRGPACVPTSLHIASRADRQAATLGQLVRATALDRHVRGMPMRHHGLMHLLEVRCFVAFFQDCTRAHVPHPRGLTHAAGMQSHLPDLALARR